MYIKPDTYIELYTSVKLDPSCQETIYFSSRSAQNDFFENNEWGGKTTIILTKYSFTPDSKNSVKIDYPYEQCYNVNYMRFKSSNHLDKWFYAFVTKVELVNESCCRIYWELDRMQTWLVGIDYELSSCMVEREHSITDDFGDNLIDEELGISDYKFASSILDSSYFTTNSYINEEGGVSNYNFYYLAMNIANLYFIEDGSFSPIKITPITATLYDNTVCAGGILVFNINTEYNKIKSVFNLFNDAPEKILQVYMIPKGAITSELKTGTVFLTNDPDKDTKVAGVHFLISGSTGRNITWNTRITHDGTDVTGTIEKKPSIDNYNVVNKKLFTYPYNFLTVFNSNGENQSYRFEFIFNEGAGAVFKIQDKVLAPYSMACRINGYKGWSPGFFYGSPLFSSGLSVTNTPMVNWSNDAYKAWLNTQGKYNFVGSGSSSISALLGGISRASEGINTSTSETFYSSNALGVTNEAFSIKSTAVTVSPTSGAILALTGAYVLNKGVSALQQFRMAKTHDIGINGTLASDSLDYAHNQLGFYAVRTFITKEWAEKLDRFFTAFGYAQKCVKIPNCNARPYWTYTKTIGSCIKSQNVSADDIAIINKIFDNGVRFYNNIMPVLDMYATQIVEGEKQFIYDNRPSTT